MADGAGDPAILLELVDDATDGRAVVGDTGGDGCLIDTGEVAQGFHRGEPDWG